jgi:hypothetical protein
MDKSEMKAAVLHEVGAKSEDMCEAARLDAARHEGGITALLAAAKQIAGLAAHVDRDMDEGAFASLDGPLAVAGAIKKYLSRAVAVAESGMKAEDNQRLVCEGRAQAFKLMVDNLKKLHDQEMEKSKSRQAIATGEEVVGRPMGVHPGLSIKEQRRLEEATVQAPPEVLKPKRKPKNARNT